MTKINMLKFSKRLYFILLILVTLTIIIITYNAKFANSNTELVKGQISKEGSNYFITYYSLESKSKLTIGENVIVVSSGNNQYFGRVNEISGKVCEINEGNILSYKIQLFTDNLKEVLGQTMNFYIKIK